MEEDHKYSNKKEKNILIQVIGNSSVFNIITTVGLVLGGILFLLYYFYIGFIPQLNSVTDFTQLLFTMATMGILLFIVLLLLFVFPALFYNDAFDVNQKKLMDTKIFIYSMSIIPFLIILYLLDSLYTEFDSIRLCLVLIYLILVSLVIFWKDFNSSGVKKKAELFVLVMIQSIAGAFSFLLFTIFVLSGQSNIVTSLHAISTFAFFSLIVIGVNTFIIDKTYYKHWALKSSIVVVIFIFLMGFFNAYAVVPSAVMNRFQLGDFFIKKITSKERSCNILLDLHSSELKINPINEKNTTCTIEGEICILSQIGTQMLWKIDKNITIRLESEDFSGMIKDTTNKRRCLKYNSDNNESE